MATKTREQKILELAGKWPEFSRQAVEAIERGTSFSNFSKEILDALADPRATPGLECGEGGYEAWRRAAPDLIAIRGAGRIPGRMPEDERARRTRAAEEAGAGSGSTLLSIGERAAGRLKQDRHGNRDLHSRIFASNGDFVGITSDAFSKLLAGFFSEQDKTYESISTVRPIADFKPASIIKTEVGNLILTPELVPVSEAVPQDAKQSLQLGTYTQSIGISRAALVNDDLAAFTSAAEASAIAAARTIGDLVYALLLSNPTMTEDSVALFATTHPSGANTVAATLDADGLGTVLGLIRSQKSLGAKNAMNLKPMAVLVPTALEGKARNVVGNFGTANELRVLVEPRLTPATSFYCVARGEGLTIGALNGRLEPSVKLVSSTPYGVRWIITLDFAAVWSEHRTWARGTA